MNQIKKIKRTYIKWFVIVNLAFILVLLAMNLFYNSILDKNLASAVFFTGLSVISIYSLAASYAMLFSRRTWKWGLLLTLAMIALLLYTSNRAIFDIFPQWGDPAYEGEKRPSMKEYLLVMGPRIFYYSFIAISIALNIRIGMLAIRKVKVEIEKVKAQQDANKMELRAWGAYTDPHFLQNELRGVAEELLYANTHEKRQYLKRRLDLLADILGYNSENVFHDRRIVVFSKELQQLQNYLESRDTGGESYRQPVLEVEGAPMGHKIVPMTLVYLAEGAFKHGDLLSEPLYIRLGLFPERIEILFRNRIPEQPRRVNSMGSGLDVIKRRLELVMPNQFTWEVGGKGEYFEVRIVINQH